MKLSTLCLLFTAVLANGDLVEQEEPMLDLELELDANEQGERMLALDTTLCASGSCCLGTQACYYAGRAGVATLNTGSCNGYRACLGAGQWATGNATIAENSCTGDYSCHNVGRASTFENAAGSCDGVRACSQGGRDAGSSLKVGPGSCIGSGRGQRACDTAGMRGTADIGAGSCIGDRPCSMMAQRGTASVGDGSCLGFQSCFLAARIDGEVHIGDNSCNGKSACRAIGQHEVEELEHGLIEIGSNACNCEGCCACLKAGDIVPDNMCNQLGDNTTECCVSRGERNPFGPLRDNNLCFDQFDKCRKATVSGDPHIRTFSGVRYDCMGQGEFVLSKSLNESDPLELRGLFVDPQFNGEEDPWENDRSAQTVTRGIAFKVDPQVATVRVTTDDINEEGHECKLYFYVNNTEGVFEEVSREEMLMTDHHLLTRPDITISSRSETDMRFRFGDYEADLTVRVSRVSRRWGCVISFSSCLKDEYHGDVVGLFGTNNPYKNDDWMTPEGEMLTIPTNPRSRAGRGAATNFCLENYCYGGAEEDSFFGANYTRYSRCDKSPYTNHYNDTLFDTMLETITETCEDQELDYNIPAEALYDAALEHHIRNQTYDQCPIEEIEAARVENEIARFNCIRTPEIVPNTGGDPHFTTWKNEHFEYHGQCDLTLVKDEDFAGGLGLDIQIRTKVVRFWSYIKSVAIRIGNEIVEFEGTADVHDPDAHYWINYEYRGDLDEFAGFPVTSEANAFYKRKFHIDLSSQYPGASLTIQIFKEFLRINFNGDETVFGNTVGLLGDYKTGKTLSRDGVTEINDYSDLGDEWQVLPSEPKLFREASHPQFPEPCIKPEDPRGERARRLSESSITVEEAEVACSSLMDELSIKDCVYDILATQDLEMVGAF